MTSRIDDLNESAKAGCVCRLEPLVAEDESRVRFLSMAVYKLDVKMRLHTSPERAVVGCFVSPIELRNAAMVMLQISSSVARA